MCGKCGGVRRVPRRTHRLKRHAENERFMRPLARQLWALHAHGERPVRVCDSKADIPTADYPTLRRIRVVGPWRGGRPTVAEKPQWEPCTPANAGNFNGTGFYFARRIQKETGVPIGLLDTSSGNM